MARVNIIKQTKTDGGRKNVALKRNARGWIKWGVGSGHDHIEWLENGRRRQQRAGVISAEALEAQRRKRLEIEAKRSGLQLAGFPLPVHKHSC